MKPLALILTDTHLKEDNTELVTDIWKQAVFYCKSKNIKKILFGGDFFTARKAQPLSVLFTAGEIFKMVRNSGIELICIPGNHDKVDYTSEESYLDVFDGHFILVKGYSFIQATDDLIIHLIPFFKENDGYPIYLQKAVEHITVINSGGLLKSKSEIPKYKHILLTHVAINGVRNNDYSVVENDLDKKNFKVFHSVFVGHYHNQSQIGKNIYYIGSAYQSNFGEDNKKGFTILNDDGSHEFVKSQFQEFIKIKIDITDTKELKKLEQEHKNSKENVRFVFEGEEAELKNVNKEKYSALGIDVTFNKDSAVPLNHDGLVAKASSISFDRSNIEEAFNTFCETKHIEDNSIGLEYLKKM